MLIFHLALFIGTAIFTFVLYPPWIKFLYAFKMGEKIRALGPKTHLKKQGTPTMGGLAFVFSVGLVTFFLNRSREQSILPLFIASLSGAFGLLEDLSKLYSRNILANLLPFFKNLGNKGPLRKFFDVFGSRTYKNDLDSFQKLLIQSTIGGFTAYWTYFKLGWHTVWFPLLGAVDVGFFYPLLVLIFFVFVLNCVAFTDGLDGLLAGLSLIAFIAWWVIAYYLGYYSLSGFCATFAGALLAFLYFNINPARIFMGNVGSHVLGATMAVIAIILHREIVLFVIGAVFLLDGISSPLQSLSKGLTKKKIFRMAPVHHHFELLGWTEVKIVFRFWVFGIVAAFAGIFVAIL